MGREEYMKQYKLLNETYEQMRQIEQTHNTYPSDAVSVVDFKNKSKNFCDLELMKSNPEYAKLAFLFNTTMFRMNQMEWIYCIRSIETDYSLSPQECHIGRSKYAYVEPTVCDFLDKVAGNLGFFTACLAAMAFAMTVVLFVLSLGKWCLDEVADSLYTIAKVFE